uniref:SID1 transmembrane family member 2 n=1 Tax=Pseudonaja textilis TaxID=8673 RepID=A0A670YBB3_PSETE
MLRAPLLLPLLPLLLPAGAAAGPAEKRVVQKEAAFEQLYGDAVNEQLLNIYAFNHSVSRNRTEGVRVSVNVLSEQKERPVLFVVRQKEAVVSFQVPLILRGLFQRKYRYQDVSRTLCQPPTKSEVETQFFFVDVSTLSATNASYQLRVSRVENFVLRTGEPFTFNATAAQPQYFKYEFPEGVDSAIIKVTSSTAFPCSVISVQDILCPVYDLDNNVAFIGTYQTMTKKAAITVQKKDFPSHSFYVVVVVKTEDEACGGPLHYYPFSKDEPVDQGNRQKTLNVVVTPAVSSEAYVDGILFCLGVFLSFYILTVLIACWENWRRQKRRQRQLQFLSAVDTPCSDGGVRGRRGGGRLRPGGGLSSCPSSARGGSCRPFAESRWGVARVPAEAQLGSDSCRDQPSVAGAPVLNQPHGQLHNSWWVRTTCRKCGPRAARTQLLVVHVTGWHA